MPTNFLDRSIFKTHLARAISCVLGIFLVIIMYLAPLVGSYIISKRPLVVVTELSQLQLPVKNYIKIPASQITKIIDIPASDSNPTARKLLIADIQGFSVAIMPAFDYNSENLTDIVGLAQTENASVDALIEMARNQQEATFENVEGVWVMERAVQEGLLPLIAVVCAGILAIVYFLVDSVRILKSPNRHPINKYLAKLGNVDELKEDIEYEFGKEFMQKIGPLSITEGWLLYRTLYNIKLIRLFDIVWIHDDVIKNKHLFVTTSKVYRIRVHLEKDGSFVLNFKRKSKYADAALIALEEYVPWAVIGSDDDFEASWQYNREDTLKEITANRDEHLAKLRKAASK